MEGQELFSLCPKILEGKAKLRPNLCHTRPMHGHEHSHDQAGYRKLALAVLASAMSDYRSTDACWRHDAERFLTSSTSAPIRTFWCILAGLTPARLHSATLRAHRPT
jgi:hypothetical protein